MPKSFVNYDGEVTQLYNYVQSGMMLVVRHDISVDLSQTETHLFDLFEPQKKVPQIGTPEAEFLKIAGLFLNRQAQVIRLDVNVDYPIMHALGRSGSPIGPGVKTVSVEFVASPQAVAMHHAAQTMQQVWGQQGAMVQSLMSARKKIESFPPVLQDMGVTDELITGYRDFDLHDRHSGLILSSRNGTDWMPGSRLDAYCKNNVFAYHDAPSLNCQCGIYAFDSPKHPDLDYSRHIWGEVYLWGEVLICQSGYRAEFAYPKTIFIRDTGTRGIRRFRDNIEKSYGVPTFLVVDREGKDASEIIGGMLDNFLIGSSGGGETNNDDS